MDHIFNYGHYKESKQCSHLRPQIWLCCRLPSMVRSLMQSWMHPQQPGNHAVTGTQSRSVTDPSCKPGGPQRSQLTEGSTVHHIPSERNGSHNSCLEGQCGPGRELLHMSLLAHCRVMLHTTKIIARKRAA